MNFSSRLPRYEPPAPMADMPGLIVLACLCPQTEHGISYGAMIVVRDTADNRKRLTDPETYQRAIDTLRCDEPHEIEVVKIYCNYGRG